MKMRRSQLKQIIKEELENVLREDQDGHTVNPYLPNPAFEELGKVTRDLLLQIKQMVLKTDKNLLKDEEELDKFLKAADLGNQGEAAEKLLYDLFMAGQLGASDVSHYILDDDAERGMGALCTRSGGY